MVPNRKDTLSDQKIELAYNTIKKQKEEKEEQDLLQHSHSRAIETVAMPYPARTGLSLYQHFQKIISPPIIKFLSIEKSNPISSGEDFKVWKGIYKIYSRPSIHHSLSFILAMSLPRTTQTFSHFSQWR